ncbi:MAG: hypothetical protein AB8B65_16260 [Kordia sp.]|uniref:hypothetical protein n=1 Tax=Kordia sp. TaxID=1965332 RepID=UPI00385A0579
MFIEILKYGFLVIFFSTAIIGIASIPGWIKIPEWYRKRIFIVLVLEVIGVIIIYSQQEFNTSDSTGVPEISIENNNWIAIDNNGKIVKPEIIIKTKDTTIRKVLGEQSDVNLGNLRSKIVEDGLSIINPDSISLGYIKALDLQRNGLFNSLNNGKTEVAGSDNYALVKWRKLPGENWTKKGKLIPPLQLTVKDGNSGTYYEIKNKRDKVLFDSRNDGRDLFNSNIRILHFFQEEGAFYILRISHADLTSESKHVEIINAKMEPTFN